MIWMINQPSKLLIGSLSIDWATNWLTSLYIYIYIYRLFCCLFIFVGKTNKILFFFFKNWPVGGATENVRSPNWSECFLQGSIYPSNTAALNLITFFILWETLQQMSAWNFLPIYQIFVETFHCEATNQLCHPQSHAAIKKKKDNLPKKKETLPLFSQFPVCFKHWKMIQNLKFLKRHRYQSESLDLPKPPSNMNKGLLSSLLTATVTPMKIKWWRDRPVNQLGAPGPWEAPYSWTLILPDTWWLSDSRVWAEEVRGTV